MNFMGQIPDIARARVPLISFAVVEWHPSDRVMRQFGLQQPILQDPINLEKQHKMDLRGKIDYKWQQKHDPDQCVPSNSVHNPMQTMNDIYVKCNEMMNAFAQLLPTAFSTTNYEAPPTHTFDMSVAHEFQ
ncbi:hypothetical protein Lal_00024318 [Lupinus albus]|nr:hypothetical protein Lal_00024318 [Lupinus albus]